MASRVGLLRSSGAQNPPECLAPRTMWHASRGLSRNIASVADLAQALVGLLEPPPGRDENEVRPAVGKIGRWVECTASQGSNRGGHGVVPDSAGDRRPSTTEGSGRGSCISGGAARSETAETALSRAVCEDLPWKSVPRVRCLRHIQKCGNRRRRRGECRPAVNGRARCR
jgi:hypothetical protein